MIFNFRFYSGHQILRKNKLRQAHKLYQSSFSTKTEWMSNCKFIRLPQSQWSLERFVLTHWGRMTHIWRQNSSCCYSHRRAMPHCERLFLRLSWAYSHSSTCILNSCYHRPIGAHRALNREGFATWISITGEKWVVFKHLYKRNYDAIKN